MTSRIFRSICLVALAVFLSCLILIMGVMYEYFSGVQQKQLKMQTSLAAQGVNNEGYDYLDGLETDEFRLTWISPDGTVLYDSQTDSSTMENHLEREEIREAFETGYGESVRYSSTMMERSLYSAKLTQDGSVLQPLNISEHNSHFGFRHGAAHMHSLCGSNNTVSVSRLAHFKKDCKAAQQYQP